MSKKMLINATHPEENRVAIVDDGILTELDIEIAGKEQTKGNIYKAAVVRVEPGLQAAFIDYGGERFGFLQMGEIHPSYFRPEGNGDKPRYPRINDVLRRGQELLVQVVKEERGTKGAALTTFLSLPGRYMVLMPDSDTKGVSRKIEEESQRRKLKEAMASLDLPPNMGYIVRTAGIGQKKEELRRDFDYLVRVYESIQEASRAARAPALVYKESNLVIRSLRDYFSAEMDEVLVDDPRVCQEAKDFFQAVMPEYARLVRLHQEKRPIFARYQIEEQIETITKNKVPLPSGGSIVIDATEALVAIDVNSGKMAGEQGVEATAYKTNLEAAAEAARQLRLRDLGGLIVLDFIDMRERKHIRDVEKALKDALKYDKARVTVGRISQFGLLEMSRQRIKATLAEGAYLACPHCHGSGRVKSAEAQAIAFLRKVHAAVAKGQVGRIDGEIPLDVATYLLNTKREELLEMERQHQVSIFIKGRPDFIAGQAELTTQKREREEAPGPDFLPAVAPPPPLPEPLAVVEAIASPLPGAMEEEEAEASEEGGRKKRKRKRRKKRPEEAAATAEEVSAEGSPEHQPEEPEVVAGAPEEGTEEESAALTAGTPETPEEGGRKKRKRRRRKKKPEAGVVAADQPAAPAETEALAAGPETPLQAEVETKAEPAELLGEGREERRKKRRRKKKKAVSAEVAPSGATPALPEPVGETPTEAPPLVPGQPEIPAEEPAKALASRHRRRGRRSAGATVENAPQGTTTLPESPEPIAEEAAALGSAPAEATPPPRPSRNRRKTRATQEPAPVPTEATELPAADSGAAPASQTDAETAAPARRPRPSRRRRPEEEALPALAPEPAPSVSMEPGGVEPPPPKRAPRKKSAARKKAEPHSQE